MDIPNLHPGLPPAGYLRLTNPSGKLLTTDPNGMVRTVQTDEADAMYLPFDGEPANYVAIDPAAPASATYTGAGAGGSLLLTARTVGDIPLDLVLVDPAAPLSPISMVDGDGVVTVSLETGAGDAAVCAFDVGVGGTGHKITTTLTTAGTDGNEKRIVIALPMQADPLGGTMPQPSQATATGTYDAPNFNILLATGTGTKGVLTMTESVIDGASYASFKIETTDAYAGAWGNGAVICQMYGNNQASQAISCYATISGVTVYLPTDWEGVIIPTSSATIVSLINSKLTDAGINTKLIASPVGVSSLLFSSPSDLVSMADGVNAGALTTDVNQATAIALLINTLADTASSSADAGTDLVAVGGPHEFTGGGANAAITTTLTELKERLNVSPNGISPSALIVGGAIATGGTLCEAGTITLTGGTDEVPSVPGTPAHLGRLAIDGGDVWTAMADDPTVTQDGWVKTFTGGA